VNILRVFKLFVSGVLIAVWFILTAALAFLAIITVIPLLVVVMFPEILFIWCFPVIFFLAFGGWIPEKFVQDLQNSEWSKKTDGD